VNIAGSLRSGASISSRPDLRDKIRAIDVLTPDDLRDRNPNTASGNPYAGPGEPDQSFPWRPLPSSRR
jgi:phytoene dehydrogenase-like protein